MAQSKPNAYEIMFFSGGLSDYEDRGVKGAFKFGSNLDIRKAIDSLSCKQALVDIDKITIAISSSQSPSSSASPSPSNSPSPSLSVSPSASVSPSGQGSTSRSPSSSSSPSSSPSPSASISASNSISPSPSPSAGISATTIFKDLIYWFVKASDGFIYGFGNTGKIYKINPVDGFASQVYDAGQKIRGAEEKPSATGKTYLVWATNTNLHRKEIPGRADWNDVDAAGTVRGDTWPKINLDSVEWHTMRQVGGDVLIGNGSKLAMAAYDDSYTNEALDLIPGNLVKTLVERRGRVVIGTVRASDPTKGINGAIDAEVPLVQIGDQGQVSYADFSSTVAAKRFPGGGKVNPGGVCNEIEQAYLFDWKQTALSYIDKQAIGNMALFGVWGASVGTNGVYSYGRLDKAHPFVMNLDYRLDVDEIGAICHSGNSIFASYRLGTGFGVKMTDQSNKATGTFQGLDFHAPIQKAVNITKWDLAELYMAKLPAGCSVEFWYRLNKTGNFVQANTTDGHSSYAVVGGEKATFSIAGDAEVFEPMVVLNPSGNTCPEVYRNRIFFS